MQALRPYQEDAVASVLRDWPQHPATLGVAATGAGKTQIFLVLLMRTLQAGQRALVISHRVELVDQPLQRIGQIDPDWLMSGALDRPRVGVIQADRGDYDRQITFATVQSLRGKRLERLLSHGPIDYLIIDEAHHSTANTYETLVKALLSANPEMRHLGVTATPLRADGDGLSKIYGHVSFRITIADLVRMGYLVQPRWLGIATGLSLQGVHTRNGDFVQGELAGVYDTPAGRRIIVEAYQKYGAGRRGIAFTASVAGAHALAAEFRAVGVAAEAIDASTPKDRRRQLLADFRAGEITLLCNVDVLTEGFDAPGANIVLMCRPTRSDGRYIQAMGRGLRPAMGTAQPGEDCLILDFLPADSRNIVMAGDVLGLPKEVTRTVLDEEKEVEEGAVQAGFTFDGENFDSAGTPLEIISRELNYLEQSPYVWGRRDALMTLGCGKGPDGIDRILAVKDGTLYAIWRREGYNGKMGDWQVAPVACDDPYAEGQALAEKHSAAAIASKGKGWRNAPASEPQINYLRRLARGRIKLKEIQALTKGQAAELITHYQAAAAIEQYERQPRAVELMA